MHAASTVAETCIVHRAAVFQAVPKAWLLSLGLAVAVAVDAYRE